MSGKTQEELAEAHHRQDQIAQLAGTLMAGATEDWDDLTNSTATCLDRIRRAALLQATMIYDGAEAL